MLLLLETRVIRKSFLSGAKFKRLCAFTYKIEEGGGVDHASNGALKQSDDFNLHFYGGRVQKAA